MWTPKQLLARETVDALRMGGFSNLNIEFLGWLSGYAQAINNSANPVKAAHTILAKPKTIKMLHIFAAKKKESVAPKDIADHDAADLIFQKLDTWQEQQQESLPQDPGAQDFLDNE
jgi:hypothetical protein